jgi:nitrate reductase delta subunit
MDPNVYAVFGTLLECPAGDYGQQMDRAWEALQGSCPEAAASLAQFRSALGDPTAPFAEESYLRAFDIAPLCVPYVSVHLFGEENYRRGEFMARLKEAYEKEGFDPGLELTDHLSVLLRFAPVLSWEERRELLGLCLKGPLEAMKGTLEKAKSPYRLLLQALWETIETDLTQEGTYDLTPVPLLGAGIGMRPLGAFLDREAPHA